MAIFSIFCFYKASFSTSNKACELICQMGGEGVRNGGWADIDYLTLYPKVITAGGGPQQSGM